MARDRRTELQALEKSLRERVGTYDVDLFLKWVGLQLEGLKANLVTCAPDDFRRLQGEAQGYEKMIRTLTRPDTTKPNTKE